MQQFAKFAEIAAFPAMVAGAAARGRAQPGQPTAGGIGLVLGAPRSLNSTFTLPAPGEAAFAAGALTRSRRDGAARLCAGACRPARWREALTGPVAFAPASLLVQSGFNVAAGVAGIDLRRVR